YIGCEYWPVDLDNAVEVLGQPVGGNCDATGLPSAVIADLPTCNGFSLCDYGGDCSAAGGGTCTTTQVCALDAQHAPFAIVVSNPNGGEMPATVTLQNKAGMRAQVTVNSHEVKTIFPQMLGFPDQSLDFSGIEDKAYKLTSNVPIVAYQFNPLNNVGVFSNDPSLLIHANT